MRWSVTSGPHACALRLMLFTLPVEILSSVYNDAIRFQRKNQNSRMLNRTHCISIAVLLCFACGPVMGEEPSLTTIEASRVNLRAGAEQEWAWFPEAAVASTLARRFNASSNPEPWTLTVRQDNVKQLWEVRINDQVLGRLERDENDMIADFVIPAGCLHEGENLLEIAPKGDLTDDIRVGPIHIHQAPIETFRNQATINIQLVDSSGTAIPGRITILDDRGTLVPVGAKSNDHWAVRNGVLYTSTGEAEFGVASGKYRIVAGRGFEYSLAKAEVDLHAGEHIDRKMTLVRQVDTAGWVACDPHVHTVTHSGHGDCTIGERMVTLAGEGIELPIATDHNKAIDYTEIAASTGVTPYFTPVIGDECTTKKGHFNIFPLRAGSPLPDHTQQDWGILLQDIYSTPDVRVAILNHARDIHSGFRPFSPVHHIALTGENLEGRPMQFNAMEIINSGAVQTDGTQLFHDWCGLINRGLQVTPIGSSDSHDVARYVVGQGRTYIRCDDSTPGKINISNAIDALTAGRVIVSYGLLVRLRVGEAAQAGDLVSLDDLQQDLIVTADVLGPAWTDAESVALYVCGRERFRHSFKSNPDGNTPFESTVTWRIPRSEISHDLWLSAVAVGPGIDQSYWKTALPYQPTSKAFSPSVFSSTGAIRIDADGDGKYTSPFGYAKALVEKHAGDTAGLLRELKKMDASVIHQVASLWRVAGEDLTALLKQTEEPVGTAMAEYIRAHRRSVVAKIEGSE